MTENGTKKLTFLSTLSLRRATCYSFRHSASCWYFYPRSPCGERQRLWIMLYSCPGNFYPRSPCGERPPSTLRHCTTYLFLSTLSLRRATGHGHTGHGGVPFLSTLSLRRATRASSALSLCSVNFYPRSPCGERPDSGIGAWRYRYFYPRSPCGERPCCPASSSTRQVFLSTLSLRRATDGQHRRLSDRQHFYPRSPCGERPHILRWDADHLQPFLSTLSLRRATVAYHAMCRLSRFLSTLSLRRATEPDPATDRIVSHFYPRSPCGERRAVFNDLRESAGISIHALLAESDQRPSGCRSGGSYFYPRSPCGERPCHAARCCQRKPFLSTLSLRRATSCCSLLFFLWGNFYPRSPCGERRHMYEGYRHTERFLSTLSLRRATPGIQRLVALLRQFLSTLSLRRATSFCRQPPPTRWISIHALLAESDSWAVTAA